MNIISKKEKKKKEEEENLNISDRKKIKNKKIKKEKKQVLQLPFMRFHILKSLYNIFIINLTSNISFNVHSQTIIHPLIFHLIDLFQNF